MGVAGELTGLRGRLITVGVLVGTPLAAIAVGATVTLVTAEAGVRTAPAMVLIAALLSLAALVAGLLGVSRTVAAPVSELVEALDGGEPEAIPDELRDREDEVGALARSLYGALEVVRDQRQVIEDLSLRDAETGLYGPREVRQRLENEVALARRHGRQLTLAVVAVDGRERLPGGLARSVASAIVAAVRPTDVVGRLGPARFGVLLAETGHAGSRVVVDRIRAGLAADGAALTVSVGFASFPADAGTVEQLAQASDDAVASAATRGGDQVRHYGSL